MTRFDEWYLTINERQIARMSIKEIMEMSFNAGMNAEPLAELETLKTGAVKKIVALRKKVEAFSVDIKEIGEQL